MTARERGSAVRPPMSAARRAAVLEAYAEHTRRFAAITSTGRRSTDVLRVAGTSSEASHRDSGGLGAAGVELSRRELEVLGLVALGQSNAEIAVELGVTLDTVKSHVKAIL